MANLQPITCASARVSIAGTRLKRHSIGTLLVGLLLTVGNGKAQTVSRDNTNVADVGVTIAAAAFGPRAVPMLPTMTVTDHLDEHADGPVNGYRATRSATFTKIDTPLKEVPASVTVLPAQLMKDQAMQSLADVIRYVPGALAHQGEGNRDQVILRGNSTTADFYLDGVRDDAQVFRDLYNLERVEVLKGPGSMIFGRGGAGGVVNRVTRQPRFESFASGTLTIGSWRQMRATLDSGDKIGGATAQSAEAAWRLNAMGERTASFRDEYDVKRYALNPAFASRIGSSTWLTMAYERQYDDRTADRGIPSRAGRPFETNPERFFGNAAQSRARSTADTLSAVLEHGFAGVQLKNTFRVAGYDKFYQNVYPGGAVNTAGMMTITAYNNANQRTNTFNQTDLTGKLSTGAIEHTWLVGLEVGHQRSDSVRNTGFFGNATSATVLTELPFATATRFAPNGTDANSAVRADILAMYVQDQVALDLHWKILAGVRVDRFSVDVDDKRLTTTALDLTRTDIGTSPRAGLIWTPAENMTCYASISYAFLPSAEQLGLATTTANLRPETATNVELGVRWDVRRALTLSSSVFRLERNDVRVADPLRAGYFIKTGQLRTQGIEVSLQGEISRHWQVFGGYAFLDGRVTQPINTGTTATLASIVPAGNKIGLVPRNTFSLWNRFTFDAVWSAAIGVVAQSASFTSINNTVSLPAFARADAAVYYTFAGGKNRLALNIENLTGKKYYPTADGDNNISPGAPRSARLTMAWSY